MGLSYTELCTIGTAMIIGSTSFVMGVFFASQPYDYHVLFNANATKEHFDNALNHYQTLFYTAKPTLYILAFVVLLGILGSLIKVYKPNPELQLFEYGSLGLFVLGICVFLTNIKTGVESAVYQNWGEVTESQGIAVIASSNIILLIVFFGVLILQAGLWYSNWDYQKRLALWRKTEAKEAKASAEEQPESKKSKSEIKKDSKKDSKKQK